MLSSRVGGYLSAETIGGRNSIFRPHSYSYALLSQLSHTLTVKLQSHSEAHSLPVSRTPTVFMEYLHLQRALSDEEWMALSDKWMAIVDIRQGVEKMPDCSFFLPSNHDPQS